MTELPPMSLSGAMAVSIGTMPSGCWVLRGRVEIFTIPGVPVGEISPFTGVCEWPSNGRQAPTLGATAGTALCEIVIFIAEFNEME